MRDMRDLRAMSVILCHAYYARFMRDGAARVPMMPILCARYYAIRA